MSIRSQFSDSANDMDVDEFKNKKIKWTKRKKKRIDSMKCTQGFEYSGGDRRWPPVLYYFRIHQHNSSAAFKLVLPSAHLTAANVWNSISRKCPVRTVVSSCASRSLWIPDTINTHTCVCVCVYRRMRWNLCTTKRTSAICGIWLSSASRYPSPTGIYQSGA